MSQCWIWWETRRIRYNLALAAAGIVAFIIYAVIGCVLIPTDQDFEITPFTILFQGMGYLVAMGVANICYFLGPLSERMLGPASEEKYRRICFGLGLWFSVLLPFSAPVLLLISISCNWW